MASSPDNRNAGKPVDDDVTGLKLLPTWRAVYIFVLGSFALWILLLVALTRMYS